MISPLDSRLSILNPVNHFSTQLILAKAKPYVYTFALITLLLVYHHDVHFMLHLFVITHVATLPCHLASSSHVLQCLTQVTQTQDISNLVSLITKTKLELS